MIVRHIYPNRYRIKRYKDGSFAIKPKFWFNTIALISGDTSMYDNDSDSDIIFRVLCEEFWK